MEQVEYLVVSGGNTIAVATVLLETGMIPMQEPVTEFKLEAPAGLIAVRAGCHNGKVTQVTFEKAPAFAAHVDAVIDVPELVRAPSTWDGAACSTSSPRPSVRRTQLTPAHGGEIARVSSLILRAAQDQLPPVEHPHDPGIGITSSRLSGPTDNPDVDRKNVVTVASGDVDFDDLSTGQVRSTGVLCGTGTCARLATLHAKGELGLNETFRHEGVLGTVYTGELVREEKIGNYAGVVPTIGGRAWISGYSTWVLDPDDPVHRGLHSDIWA